MPTSRGLNLDERFPIHPFDPNMVIESTPWLVENLWQLGKINALFAPEKSGKSRLLCWLLAGVLGGESVLGLGVSARISKVLFLHGEEQEHQIVERLKLYAPLQDLDYSTFAERLSLVEAAGMRLDFDEQRNWLERKLLDGGYNMLVIDPMRRVHGADENSNTEMATLHNTLRRWSNKHGVSIVMVHHTGRLALDADMNRIATWARGATDLAAIVDTAQFLDRRGKQKLQLFRAGRFEPLDPLDILDLGDKRGFERGTK